MTAVDGLLPVRPTAPRRPPIADYIFGSLLALLVLDPYIVSELLKTRLAAILLITAAIVYESFAQSRRAAAIAIAVVVPYACLIIALYGQLRLAGNNSYEVERIFFIVPAGLRMGYLVMQNDRIKQWAEPLVYIGLANAVLAVIEQHVGHSLLGRSVTFALMQRDGGTRALLASDHSLVLGACLATCVPLIAVAGVRWRIAPALVLLWGTWATGSRGPTLIALIVTVAYGLPRFEAWLRNNYRLLRNLAIAGLVFLGAMGIFVWKPVATGSNGSQYSTSYREALYAVLPHMLRARSFGYGLGGLPSNVWLINSGIFGVKDISVTIDSELVVDAALFGFVGVALFVAALMVAVNAIGRNPYVGMAACTVTMIGLFLALSSWDSLGPFWYFLLGCAIYLNRRRVAGAQ